ncbi:MAG: hypothetical protein ACE14M_02480 [Terriglobales bacterium]
MTDPNTIRPVGEVIAPGEPPVAEQLQPRDFSGVALAIAILADLLQLVLLPLFAEGILSPLNDLLDIVVAMAMVKLIGWHWAFLPSFLGELVPVFDVFPCWTLAVLFVRAERAKLQAA